MVVMFSVIFLMLNYVPQSSAYERPTNKTNSSCLVVSGMTLSQLCVALKIWAIPYNNTLLIANTTAYCNTLVQEQLVRATNLSTSLYFYFSTVRNLGGNKSPLLKTSVFKHVKGGYGRDDEMKKVPKGIQNTTMITVIYCLGYQYLFDNALNPSLQIFAYNDAFDNVNDTVDSEDDTVSTTVTTRASTVVVNRD
jgi:hypothetical protein